MSESRILIDTVVHRNGIWWYDAPRPPRFLRQLWRRLHRHRVWTSVQMAGGYELRRCACGATSYSDLPGWQPDRSRRRSR